MTLIGPGTVLELPIYNYIDSIPGEITYNVSAKLTTAGSMKLIAKGLLKNPNTSRRRRYLSDSSNK